MILKIIQFASYLFVSANSLFVLSSAMDQNYENMGNRSRFPSSSSEEKSTSSELIESNVSKPQEIIQSIDDPLANLLDGNEIKGFYEIDQKDYDGSLSYFGRSKFGNSSSLALLMSGEMHENGPYDIGQLFSWSYPIYHKALIKADQPFLIAAAQRAFDRITIKYSLHSFQLPVVMKKPSHISLKITVEHTRQNLTEFTNYINQSYSYFEIFNKIEGDLIDNLVFSEFFKIINFPQYKQGESYPFLWKQLQNHFADEFAIYSNNVGEPIISPLSVDIKNLKAEKEINPNDPFVKYFKVHPFIVNGFNALDHGQYERAYVLFFHYFVLFIQDDQVYKLNTLADLIFDEILEIGVGFMPATPGKALYRFEDVVQLVKEDNLKRLFHISAGRIKQFQEAEKLKQQIVYPPKEIKKSKKESVKKATPQSLDLLHFTPKLISGFLHDLLKTTPFIKINDALNMGMDFTFTDLLRITLYPDYYEKNNVLEQVWVTLAMTYGQEFLEFARQNNIQVTPPTPAKVVKKPVQQNNVKSSWWPLTSWFGGEKDELDGADTIPFLETKKRV